VAGKHNDIRQDTDPTAEGDKDNWQDRQTIAGTGMLSLIIIKIIIIIIIRRLGVDLDHLNIAR
jgi:hypothetical protein